MYQTLYLYYSVEYNLSHILVPDTPTNFNITDVIFGMINYTVTYEWNPPPGFDFFYIFSIAPEPSTEVVQISDANPPLNLTVDYNMLYIASIVSVNCVGESNIVNATNNGYGTYMSSSSGSYYYSSTVRYKQRILLKLIVNILLIIVASCGVPIPHPNGSVLQFDRISEGAIVTHICDEGFRPSYARNSTCTSNGLWIPPLDDNCTFITGIQHDLYNHGISANRP